MDAYSIADAKSRFSALVERAEAGEEVEITRRGKPVARIVPLDRPRKKVDLAALRALTDGLPMQQQGAGEFIREMRDSARY